MGSLPRPRKRYAGISRASPNDLAAYKVLARLEFAKRRPDLAADTLGQGRRVRSCRRRDLRPAWPRLCRDRPRRRRSEGVPEGGKLAPNDVGLQTRLASARMGMGEAESAMGDLEHTLQLAPTAPQVGEALFFAALATGDLDKAKDAIEQGARRTGRYAGGRESRGPAETGAARFAGATRHVPRHSEEPS